MINLVYLVLLTLPAYLVRFDIVGMPTTLLEVEIYLLFIVFIVDSLSKKYFLNSVKSFLKNPFLVPLALLFIGGLISIFVSPDKLGALGIFKAYFIDPALFFFLFTSVVKEEKEIRNSIIAVVLSAVVLSLIGLVQYFGLHHLLQDGRIRSIYSSPNYLSLYITPVIFLIYYLAKEKKNIAYPFLFAMLVLIVTLVLTYSRGAWMAFLVALFFYSAVIFAERIRRSRNIVTLGFVVGLLLIFLFITQGSYALNIIPNDRVVKSDDVRVEIWKTSLDIGENNWLLGVGLGNFQNYFSDFTEEKINYPEYITPHAITPHNVFLNVWLQTGLLGLIGFLGVLILFFKKGFDELKNRFLISSVLMSSMIAIVIHGLVDSSIWKNDLIIYFVFLIGMMFVVSDKSKNRNAK